MISPFNFGNTKNPDSNTRIQCPSVPKLINTNSKIYRRIVDSKGKRECAMQFAPVPGDEREKDGKNLRFMNV